MTYTKYKEWLKANLDEERYEHSIGTAECAAELAERFGLDKEKAYLCGLIHDCAKCFKNEELREAICNCTDLCDGELINPKTYHAPAGALLAKQELGICDEEILSATRWHTLGKIEMSDFEKIVFLADKIEKRTRPLEYRIEIVFPELSSRRMIMIQKVGNDRITLSLSETPNDRIIDNYISKMTSPSSTVSIALSILERRFGEGFISDAINKTFNPVLVGANMEYSWSKNIIEQDNERVSNELDSVRLIRAVVDRFFKEAPQK